MNKLLKVASLVAVMSAFGVTSVSAAALTNFTYRQSTIKASAAGTTYVQFTAPSGFGAVTVTYPAGYTVAAAPVAADPTTTGTSNWTGTACTYLAPSAAAGAGQVVTLTAAGTVAGTYCVEFTGITNTASVGNANISVSTDTPDSMDISYPTVSDDAVVINAAVAGYVTCDVTTTAGSDDTINLGVLRYGTITSSSTLGTPDNIQISGGTNAAGMSWYYRSDASVNGLRSTTASYTMAGSDAEYTLLPTQTVCSGTSACFGIYYNGTTASTAGTWTADAAFTGSTVTTAVGPMTTNLYGVKIGSTGEITSGLTADFNVNATPAQNTPAATDYTDTLIFVCSATL